ncbi:MAG: hypothetical protein AUI83_03535 [Armatimonadetes bacterium 13_1_40CM_3_65_7]|nr:MAG: hypothetical protein AUI83_03535 [Armatimonadetes bacterium 13_1_40CM_3_65_7]
MGKWAVAMSGGVDSSVAAGLLAAEGHEVVGLTMNLWPDWLPEPDDAFKACCGVSAIEDARAVAHRLDIRHYVLNMPTGVRPIPVLPAIRPSSSPSCCTK